MAARLTRDWGPARAKVEAEGRCRVCGQRQRLEAAHIWKRSADFFEPMTECGFARVRRRSRRLLVAPERIVPLCGPATDPGACHCEYDGHRLDLLPVLRVEEVVQAVLDAEGLARAYARLTGGGN